MSERDRMSFPETPVLDRAKVPFPESWALGAAKFFYQKDRANPQDVWNLAQEHTNPQPKEDNFKAGLDRGLWHIAWINGSGRVRPPPHGDAASIVVEDGVLKLQVRHDSDFERKSSRWRRGIPAAERYNNAYVGGMGGYLPTKDQDIVISACMKVSKGFHGTTGIWMEDGGTFDPKTGIMVKPFRSFGFSFVGETSAKFIRGLAVETCLGLSIQEKGTVVGIDVAEWHDYTMRWSWLDERRQEVTFMIGDQSLGALKVDPFGPGEIQLWSDNYKIGRGLRIGYLNVPTIDETQFNRVRVEAVGRNEGR